MQDFGKELRVIFYLHQMSGWIQIDLGGYYRKDGPVTFLRAVTAHYGKPKGSVQ